MDILKAEIARKRKQLIDNDIIKESKKYFKGSEVIQKQIQYYNNEEDDNNVQELSQVNNSSEPDINENATEHQTLSRKEVIRRFRERCEPILLFGESELDAFKRLRQCEILEPEINKGFRNDFQEALEKVDQAYLDEIISSNTEGGLKNDNLINMKDLNKSYEEVLSEAINLGKGDLSVDMDIIMKFLQLLLNLWNNHLNNLPMMEKSNTKSKMAFATYTQTQQYLKPLFRKLKNKTLPEDILDSLTIITRHLLNRNYIMASDAYLQMAIGNAPWPIGVTMVGIHARTGREKIFSKNVAHVLNDETQRKYIQALKRLMTKCQYFFPTDPSRCVEYINDAV